MTKNKHDHTATKKIKAWLFAIMLLLPFLFLLPTGLYYGLNQNAQLSERTEQQPIYYESNEVTQDSDIIIGNIYSYNNSYTYQNIGGEGRILGIDLELFKYQFTAFENYELTTVYFYYVPNNSLRLLINYINNNTQVNTQIDITNGHFYFIPVNIITSQYVQLLTPIVSETDFLWIKEYQETITSNDISTSIINAWNSTWQNPLFNWTNYSPFYTPMQNFTNVFGINNMQIANVLTYLATMTAIYIVFDIIIELFTYLTHLIPRSE